MMEETRLTLRNPSTSRAGVLISPVNLESRQQLSVKGQRHSAGPQLYNPEEDACTATRVQAEYGHVGCSRGKSRNHFHQNEWFGVYICNIILHKKCTKLDCYRNTSQFSSMMVNK